jgi:phosphoglycolate phosphatase
MNTPTPPSTWDVILWDLDGTITDPKEGIIGAYQAFLGELGEPVPEKEDLLWVIGPPLRDCMKQILGSKYAGKDLEPYVARYRYWYVNDGLMYRDTPYEGIATILQGLKDRNKTQFVATAKAHSYAKKILSHWSLDGYFEDICGSELDGTRAYKADLIRWMFETKNLEQLSDRSSIVMIGDRKHDMEAAKANGIATIGVGYGYGGEMELKAANADYYCHSIQDLSQLLLR